MAVKRKAKGKTAPKHGKVRTKPTQLLLIPGEGGQRGGKGGSSNKPNRSVPQRAPAPLPEDSGPGKEAELASPMPPAARKPARRATAEQMAAKQREISISEFFTKNRHLLGFDSPSKALLTAVKEAVDNSLDACEEGGILPDILVEIRELSEDRFVMAVEDNGPGIVKAQIPKVFGKLLYGSKFHRLKMSRGQQGIGISAAGMYGMLTTGKSVEITSRPSPKKDAHHYHIQIDTRKNEPVIVKDESAKVEWTSGTEVEIELVAS